MQTLISIPSLKMLMSGYGEVRKFMVSSETSTPTKRMGKPLFLSSTFSLVAPTLNQISFMLSTILLIHFVMSISGTNGHPLEARLPARDITESNNNLLKWWAVASGEVAARQMNMNSPLGAGTEEEGEQMQRLDFQEADDEDGDDNELPDLEATSRSNQNQRSGLSQVRFLHSRSKKGLSYLSKFYSEALLHHNGGNVGNSSGSSSSKEAQYFGERYGYGSGSSGSRSSGGFSTTFPSSGEHSRFPANVRRKLSFYPPLALMTPWRSIVSGSSLSSGRNTAMRLRWGK